MHTARGNPERVSKRALTASPPRRPAVQRGLFMFDKMWLSLFCGGSCRLPSPRRFKLKFFISYRRSAKDDEEIAHFLHQGLQEHGHEVFIDVAMPVGTDWGDEIGRRIIWCDFFVVLLSAESIHSEMVQGEVRIAHQKRKRDGTPRILPIRVNYTDPLDYELDSYLGRLQYLKWETLKDSETVLKAFCAITEGKANQEEFVNSPDENLVEVVTQEAAEAIYHRPKPVVDPRVLRPPGGTIRFNDPYYIRRSADDTTETTAFSLGETVIIRGPRQIGKSSLLLRYLAGCKAAGKQFVYLDFQSFTDLELENYETLLTKIAEFLVRNLKIDISIDAPITTQRDLTYFVEDTVRQVVTAPLVLGFDEVDRVLGRPYQTDFFSMLRLWHNRRAEPFSTWEEIDLALVISTEPYLLIDSSDRSPFNVTPPVELKPFPRGSIEEINKIYGTPLSDLEIEQLCELLGGHPFLTRLAFYRMVGPAAISFNELIDRAHSIDGPFSDHLRYLLMLLQQQPGLPAAMRQLIAHGTLTDQDTYFRLHGAGLARMKKNRVVPANLLYARFFKDRL